jgi:hypothetical protein
VDTSGVVGLRARRPFHPPIALALPMRYCLVDLLLQILAAPCDDSFFDDDHSLGGATDCPRWRVKFHHVAQKSRYGSIGAFTCIWAPRNFYNEARLNCCLTYRPPEATMNGLIYLVGLIVVIMFILSFLGLR